MATIASILKIDFHMFVMAIKMKFKPSVALAAVRSKGVVLLLLICC